MPQGRANPVGGGAAIWVAGVDTGFRDGSLIAFFKDVRASIDAAVIAAAFVDDLVGFAYDEVVRGSDNDFCARWTIRAADVF